MANIIICADGTWNRLEEDLEKDHATNVLKLARAIKPATAELKQHVFYDWGLGSYHNAVSAGATGGFCSHSLATQRGCGFKTGMLFWCS